MNADDSPVTRNAERFAAAVDGAGTQSDGASADPDPELARELAVVDRLRAHGAALDPDAETRARARRRLLAALAEERPQAADVAAERRSSAS